MPPRRGSPRFAPTSAPSLIVGGGNSGDFTLAGLSASAASSPTAAAATSPTAASASASGSIDAGAWYLLAASPCALVVVSSSGGCWRRSGGGRIDNNAAASRMMLGVARILGKGEAEPVERKVRFIGTLPPDADQLPPLRVSLRQSSRGVLFQHLQDPGSPRVDPTVVLAKLRTHFQLATQPIVLSDEEEERSPPPASKPEPEPTRAAAPAAAAAPIFPRAVSPHSSTPAHRHNRAASASAALFLQREARETHFWQTVEQIALGLKHDVEMTQAEQLEAERAIAARPGAALAPLGPNAFSFTAHISSTLHQLIHLHYQSESLEARIDSARTTMAPRAAQVSMAEKRMRARLNMLARPPSSGLNAATITKEERELLSDIQRLLDQPIDQPPLPPTHSTPQLESAAYDPPTLFAAPAASSSSDLVASFAAAAAARVQQQATSRHHVHSQSAMELREVEPRASYHPTAAAHHVHHSISGAGMQAHAEYA